MNPKIIIIDSDRRTVRLIRNILNNKYEILSSASFSEGYSLISAGEPNVILIDPQFPKKEGIALIKSVREWSDSSIIAISENGTEHAAVSAIEAGADDYIRKPFFPNELSARVDACIRRFSVLEAARGVNKTNYYKSGNLKLEFESHNVTVNGKPIHLTKNEFKILSLLCRHSGKVLTYDFILKSVWGLRNADSTGILRVNITNLRKKIEKNPLSPEYIFTENGIGYRAAQNETV